MDANFWFVSFCTYSLPIRLKYSTLQVAFFFFQGCIFWQNPLLYRKADKTKVLLYQKAGSTSIPLFRNSENQMIPLVFPPPPAYNLPIIGPSAWSHRSHVFSCRWARNPIHISHHLRSEERSPYDISTTGWIKKTAASRREAQNRTISSINVTN